MLDLAVKSDHVLLELDIVAGGISEHEPCLTIVVDKNSRVDIRPVGTAERFAQSVLERTCGRVCNSNAYAASASRIVFESHIVIEFTVAFDTLRRPSRVLFAP